ncbi:MULTISPECIES: hypothetical protein [unclassified Polynucleobacter]|uniref:hypothetical protein n=1 Tax=unclassified Polynucleobacter TaxID=2640945 RepID=UPI00257458E2|nr:MULTISPECIES: hypothetical protein [unclassified Polynucleobacter]BEI42142.1 O-antigen ligase family protein [Polynucleobacter sp. HIN10]BEI43920.1 O-antigen ligase family protein [Polynucleobacter sp. HIN11]
MNKFLTLDRLGLYLIVLSSALLGIWAVKDTIALRNILLVSGTLISIYYIAQKWRERRLKEQYTLFSVLPIMFVALTFVWVIVHYLFFSLDPIEQFKEMKSTWLRAFMASIVGLATGLTLRNRPSRLNLLWLGILIAFLALFSQYIPRALAQNKLLVPDYDHYLFHLKINTVLMGMILIAGIDGALLDHLRAIQYRWKELRIMYLVYWLLGTALALWAFVYIVDARNGIGLSTILYGFWFLCALVFFIRSQQRSLNLKSLLALLIASLGLSVVLYFAYLQMTVNKGWHTLFADAKVAVQIDRYPNWQNPTQMGYPKREDGKSVAANTYERVAWATAGTRAIMSYPQGVGTLSYPFAKHPNAPPKMEIGPNSPGIATHSGWVELGLAFGVPMLGLIFTALLMVFIRAARHAYPARMTVLGFVVLIFCLYTVGEVTVQHGIEILYYFLALLPALLFTKQRNSY